MQTTTSCIRSWRGCPVATPDHYKAKGRTYCGERVQLMSVVSDRVADQITSAMITISSLTTETQFKWPPDPAMQHACQSALIGLGQHYRSLLRCD